MHALPKDFGRRPDSLSGMVAVVLFELITAGFLLADNDTTQKSAVNAIGALRMVIRER
jgi:hypothetical protein